MFRKNGMHSKKAREVAQLIYGGAAGRLLLELSFEDDSHA
jgi:hypothetical protein